MSRPDCRPSTEIERSVAAGTTAAELFAADRAVVVARVDGLLRDLATALRRRRRRRAGPDRRAGRPVGAAPLDRARAGPGRPGAVPGGEAGHRPADRERLLLRLRRRAPVHPEDLSALEKRMSEIIKAGQRFSRRVVTEAEARAELADEPYKLRADRPQGRTATARERRWRSAAPS